MDEKLNPAISETVTAKKLAVEVELKRLQESLDEPNRKFVAYQTAIDTWNRERAVIVGDAETQDSITWLKHRLDDLTKMPDRLLDLRTNRSAVTRDIYSETRKLSEAYRRLYGPVQEFVEQRRISSDTIPLSFQVSIVEEGFANAFLDKINRQVKGTFSGVEESYALLRKKLQGVDFDKEDSVLAFVEDVYSSLHVDRRPGTGESSVRVVDQLRKGETMLGLYDYLYSLPFLTPRYALRYAGHDIYQLSPGERGLLLLVFYLLIDKDDIPLVIDQPEENLDNQTIYEVLVRCLADAKNRRQVVVVTHNPNLAVVCDAEQVIYAQRTTEFNEVTYHSGAIENPATNKHIIDVLEGTRPAFDNRESKYFG